MDPEIYLPGYGPGDDVRGSRGRGRSGGFDPRGWLKSLLQGGGQGKGASKIVAILTIAYGLAIAIFALYLRVFGDVDLIATILLFLPRWPAILPGIALSVLCLLGSRWLMAAVNIALSIAALIWVGGYVVSLPAECPDEGEMIRFASYNIGGAGYDDIKRLTEENIDVAFLEEPNQMCAEADALGRFRPYRFLPFEHLCLMTRLTVESAEERNPSDFYKRAGLGVMATAIITTPRSRFAVTGTHLETQREGLQLLIYRNPDAQRVFDEKLDVRSDESRTLRDWVKKQPLPHVVLGDFNYVQESSLHRRDWSDWQNAFGLVGWGFGHTKKSRLLGVRIDHVIADKAWCVRTAGTSEGYSGDHQPMIADLVLKPSR